MSQSSDQRSEEFLKISSQFKLGALVTEASHPVTANLSDVAQRDIAAALDLLFQVDSDVVAKFREFVNSDRAGEIKETVLRALKNGGRIFFAGCGSTGRLSIQLVSIWRDFWQRQRAQRLADPAAAEDFENRAFSVMAGGDYALIKSVEGFEDFAEFGRKQLGDLGVSGRDVVFAITEGGETSFVLGTAWKGVDAGAKVYFVYNNPDEALVGNVQRSREVIEDPRIEKINLATGPMAITGSTRMQATTIQLCVLLTILEMVLRDLQRDGANSDSTSIPKLFLEKLEEMHAALRSPTVLSQLARLVSLEESVYRAGHKNNYYADRFGIDVLTDTTERSPTYCTPPFRKFDDRIATESWAFLFLPEPETSRAWERILKRSPRCVEWSEREVAELVGEKQAARTYDIVRKISRPELMRFRIGLDGSEHRPPGPDDAVVGMFSEHESDSALTKVFLRAAQTPGIRTGLIGFGRPQSFEAWFEQGARLDAGSVAVLVPVPAVDFLLDGVTRVGVKLLLNALSTCTMVRLGRVMGNYMVWVVPSNLKLIDRSTRYVQRLAGLTYDAANRLLFEVIEYVEPRMKADQAYPPVVGLSVIRARHKLTNEAAEERFLTETRQSSTVPGPRKAP